MAHRVPTYRPVPRPIREVSSRRNASPFYSRRAWRGSDRCHGVRQLKLSTNPLCEDCQARGQLTAATQVHHKIAVGEDISLALEMTNLVSLCSSCHSRLTACTIHACTIHACTMLGG